MMTVRSPEGLSLRFNHANFAERNPHGYTDLYTEKGGYWIAQVPNTWIIEVRQPCRIWNAAQEPSEAISALLDDIERRRGDLPVDKLADLKRALQRFDSRQRRWK
jgi:hypothetical protein